MGGEVGGSRMVERESAPVESLHMRFEGRL